MGEKPQFASAASALGERGWGGGCGEVQKSGDVACPLLGVRVCGEAAAVFAAPSQTRSDALGLYS